MKIYYIIPWQLEFWAPVQSISDESGMNGMEDSDMFLARKK
jgi:hypothetical protein